jgi:hypothetical protein
MAPRCGLLAPRGPWTASCQRSASRHRSSAPAPAPARARGTLRSGRRQVHRRERERGRRALRTRRLWTVSSILPRRPQRVLACTNTMHRSLLARASGHEADVEAQARGGRNATGRAGESVTRQPDSTAGVETDRGARSHSKQVRVQAGCVGCLEQKYPVSAGARTRHSAADGTSFFFLLGTAPCKRIRFSLAGRSWRGQQRWVFLSVYISTTTTSSVLSQLQQLPTASRFKHHAKDAPHRTGAQLFIYDWWVARPIGAHGRGVMGLARYFHPGAERLAVRRPCYVAGRGWTLEEHGVLFVRRPLTVPRLCCDVRSGAYHVYIHPLLVGEEGGIRSKDQPNFRYFVLVLLFISSSSSSSLLLRPEEFIWSRWVHWCRPLLLCYSDNTHCDSYPSSTVLGRAWS